MEFSAIGSLRGVFEILIPGIFMLLNLVMIVLTMPFLDDETKNFINGIASNQALGLLIIIVFGYLIGAILRMVRVGQADTWSGRWLRYVPPRAREKDGISSLYATEGFPYIETIGIRYRQTLPPDVVDFYDKVWAPRMIEGYYNRQFFNFCKSIAISVGGKYVNEIYAAEALTRYAAETLYGLVVLFVMMSITVVLRIVAFGTVSIGLVLISIAYMVAIVIILRNFRFIRIKEVQIIFAATYMYRELFVDSETSQNDNWLQARLRRLFRLECKSESSRPWWSSTVSGQRHLDEDG